MSFNQYLPFISTTIMLGFSLYVLQRYLVRRAPYFLFWGIGLAMFGAGSFAEAYLSLSWNPWVFFVWYLFGAALNAAWIGHGTLTLLVRKPWVNVVTVLLILGSLFAGYLMLQVMPKLDSAAFTTSKPISEQYGTKILAPGQPAPAGALVGTASSGGQQVTVVRGLLPLGSAVRLTTPFFNIYGLLTLVGGAIYSAYLFWRKRVLPNRVLGNVLIAASLPWRIPGSRPNVLGFPPGRQAAARGGAPGHGRRRELSLAYNFRRCLPGEASSHLG